MRAEHHDDDLFARSFPRFSPENKDSLSMDNLLHRANASIATNNVIQFPMNATEQDETRRKWRQG